MRLPVGRIDVQPLGRRIRAPDQGPGQPVRVVDVVEAEAALDAKPPLVRRAVDALDVFHLAVLDLQADLAADAAERADRFHLGVEIAAVANLIGIEHGCRHQRAGRAGLHAFAAGDAGRLPHRIGHVEDREGVMPPARHADHVIDLHLAAGAHAKPALDAGIQIDPHRDMAVIEQRDPRGIHRRKAAVGDAALRRHVPQLRRGIMRLRPIGLIGQQEFHHHRARLFRPRAVGPDHHAVDRVAAAGGGQHPLALDLDHAGAAVAVGAVAGLLLVAQMRYGQALAPGDLPDRLAGGGTDGAAVKGEGDRVGHVRPHRGNVSSSGGSGSAPPGQARRSRHRPSPRKDPQAARGPSFRPASA